MCNEYLINAFSKFHLSRHFFLYTRQLGISGYPSENIYMPKMFLCRSELTNRFLTQEMS